MFKNLEEAHEHSLQTLNHLYKYEDFMASIRTMADLGCGAGSDLIWWATRESKDEVPKPLNIKCTGIDLADSLTFPKRHTNISYQSGDFENGELVNPQTFDILWCHDAFQYAQNPIKTLSNWWHWGTPGSMLYLGIPTTQRIHHNQLDFYLQSGCYYHHTMVSIIYMLATAGWDCRSGFFKQVPNDPWLHAIVYKSEHEPVDPKIATWHKLSELNLLPESASRSVFAHNYLRQQDLVVPWIDQSLMSMSTR
jgi:SAM-dependent methyltransferase